MKGYSDEQIINGIKARDNIVLERLYNEYHTRVIKYVTRNKGNKFEAEDVFHDTIEKLLNEIQKKDLKLEKRFEAYFTTTYQNTWIRFVKIKNKHDLTSQFQEDLAQEESDNEEDERNMQIKQLAFDALRKLDKESRKILDMFYIKKKTMTEIANKMEFKNELSAKTQKYKAFGKLKELIIENPLYKKLTNE
ncbi:MAG: hypothetical protein A2046_05955 [Bacteroidetes bacterium GWA2_30_7]|nr:MAG: hypothetical protein A2046_05955 [Bacteroidetes bacterium GWA2_30_7]